VDLITTTQLHTFLKRENDLETDALPGAEKFAEAELLAGWRDILCALPLEGTLAGVLHTKNDTLADAVKDEGTEILHGHDYFYEELLGLKFRISPFSFFRQILWELRCFMRKRESMWGKQQGR